MIFWLNLSLIIDFSLFYFHFEFSMKSVFNLFSFKTESESHIKSRKWLNFKSDSQFNSPELSLNFKCHKTGNFSDRNQVFLLFLIFLALIWWMKISGRVLWVLNRLFIWISQIFSGNSKSRLISQISFIKTIYLNILSRKFGGRINVKVILEISI